MTEPLTSSLWLKNNLGHSELIILDASQKSNQADLKSDFENTQIKGARFFDLKNDFSDQHSEFPNTLPDIKQFEFGCRKLGINTSSKIVVYDNLGIYSSPRAWWMFKIMGHENVSVLNGGLPDWKSQGYETVERENHAFKRGDFEAKFQPEMVKDYMFIVSNLNTQIALVIDARSTDRFNGIAPEPRKGLKSGHIPNSLNIPYHIVLEQGSYKSKTELTELFNDLKTGDRPLVFSCGSGVTACIVLLACELILKNEKSVYDGSWTEWAQLEN
ncbi:MAG: sulfurtransferase [Crocinitomicaceae bacterium]|nr:sulfurtransferase [Crocinitomicaceae bacterium]